MKTTFSDVALVCAFAMVFGPTPATPQVAATPTAHLDSAALVSWREDLRFMAREMEARHRNLYHTVSRATFDSAVASLGPTDSCPGSPRGWCWICVSTAEVTAR